MSDPVPIQRPPKEVGQTVSVIGASSGKVAQITRHSPDVLHMRFPESPESMVILLESSPGVYDISRNDVGLAGTGIEWDFLVEHL
jgi:hypothetical protein